MYITYCLLLRHDLCLNRRFHTESAKEWASAFKNQLVSTPVLICLTHADNLYEDCEEEIVPKCPEPQVPKMKQKFQTELKVCVFDD